MPIVITYPSNRPEHPAQDRYRRLYVLTGYLAGYLERTFKVAKLICKDGRTLKVCDKEMLHFLKYNWRAINYAIGNLVEPPNDLTSPNSLLSSASSFLIRPRYRTSLKNIPSRLLLLLKYIVYHIIEYGLMRYCTPGK